MVWIRQGCTLEHGVEPGTQVGTLTDRVYGVPKSSFSLAVRQDDLISGSKDGGPCYP